MRRATLIDLVLLLAVCLASEGRCGPELSGPWRAYTASNGFGDSAFCCVTVSENGGILAVNSARTRVCQFDGYEVKLIPLPKDIQGPVFQSPSGQLWACSSTGLKTTKGGDWQLITFPTLSPATRESPQGVLPLLPVRQNVILCLFPDSLVEVNAELASGAQVRVLRYSTNGAIGKFSTITVDSSDDLWIVGENGLSRGIGLLRSPALKNQWREYVLPESLKIRHLRNPEGNESGITMIADLDGAKGQVLVHFDGGNWETRPLEIAGMKFAWAGPDHTFWEASSNALYRWNNRGSTTVTNISKRVYHDVAMDGRGTFWLATSEGLLRFTPALWRPPEAKDQPNLSIQHAASGDTLTDVASGLMSYSADSRAWQTIATTDGKIRCKPLGLLRDGHICFQVAAPDGSPSEQRFGTFEGAKFRPFPFAPPGVKVTEDDYSCILETVTGDIWLGGSFGAVWLHNRWTVFPKAGNATPHAVRHLVELPNGQIWAASADRIWSFDGKNWITVRSGLFPITTMISTRDGSVWLGRNHGIARFFRGNWIENGVEEGLNGDRVTALCEDQRGGIWAIESNTLARFHPEADSDPPRTVLLPMSEGAKNIPENGAIAVKFGGEDRWRMTEPGRLMYSQKLDDADWSPFSPRTGVTLSDLAPGRHTLQVRSMDRAGNVETTPARLDFTVILPWYQEGRLVLIGAAGTTAALFFATLAYRRHRQLVLSYAEVEKQVAERSRQLGIANQELLQSQKMRALGTLAAGIAHDFNNILSIIKGSIQIIELNRENPEKIGTWTARVRTIVDQGSAVVQAMLGFSRSSDEALELCDVNPVIDNTIKLLGDQFLSEVQVSLESGSDLPRVRASQSLIQQILLNFIFNAAESMSDQKRIVISSARRGSLPATMALQPAAADAYVSISVRDFGCGISSENVARVFEPFFTTKSLSVHPGTGLGLSIVYELAKKMSAGLSLESALGQGSVFSLILPAGRSTQAGIVA